MKTSLTETEAHQKSLMASNLEAVRSYHAAAIRPRHPAFPVLELLSNAVVVPQRHVHRNKAGILIQDSAAYRSDGRLCALSLHAAAHLQHDNIPSPCIEIGNFEHRAGNHLYGGVLIGHFGHFLLESLSRLWALGEYDGEIETVVFVRGWGFVDGSMPRFVEETLALLGSPRITIVDVNPASFHRLIVPSQLLGCHLVAGHETFHRFVHRLSRIRTEPSTLPGDGGDVYVSRSRFGDSGGGGILCEHVIEENLRNYGYEVIYPEQLTVAQQLDVYNRCGKLVFAKGSALHLFALVAREDQDVLVINRKDDEDQFLVHQIRCFGSCRVKQCNFVRERVYRASSDNHFSADVTSLGVLDFDALGSTLQARGFIPDERRWRTPTEPELMAQLRKINPAEPGARLDSTATRV